MSSSVVNTNTDISVNNTGIIRVSRDTDAANIYLHQDRDLSPDRDDSINSQSVRSASIDSIASMTQRSGRQPSCSSAMASAEDPEPPTKKRRKQSNPVRYGQTAHQTPILPAGIDEDLPEEEDDDDESLIAAGLRVSSQLQRSGSFDSSDDDSNDDEDIDDEPSLDLERRKLIQQSVANVMNFHKYQLLCPHCNHPFRSDDDLRRHIEEEHVQKLLEQQLFQQHQHQQQLNHKSLLNGPNPLRPSLSEMCKQYDQNQHKFNSDDSGSGSSSSGSNNNSPLQSPSGQLDRKSFDATQPLPHGSSDTKDFGSNFLPFHLPPNMPPLIPMSQPSSVCGSGGGEGTKSGGQSSSPGAAPISLAMFSNPMAPFLFPILPSGPNAGSNGSAMSGNGSGSGQQVSSGGVRIFNPEAYCELCNKEFCNKYFLKTHKANKHGIYSMDTLVGPQPFGQPFFTSGLSNSGGSPTAAAAAAAMQMQHLLQSSAGMTPTSEALVVTTPMRSGVINMESFCEICQKEFCNKYFLKKHKQKIHGIVDPHNTHQSSQGSSASPGSCSNETHAKGNSPSPPLVNTSLSLPITSTSCLSSMQVSTPLSTSSPLSTSERALHISTPQMVSSHTTTSSPTNCFVCEICKHDFPNIISLQTHRFSAHYPQSMHAMIPVSSAQLQSMAAAAAGESPAPRPILGPVSALSDTGNFVFTADKLREMGVINADAFCEICCKEFCNKYFLRTHKINKHGLSFDSNSSTKSQSGRNSNDNKGEDSNMSPNDNDDSFLEPGQRDPTTYSNGSEFFNAMSGLQSELQCELCCRPFGSHYLLKMHKFYSHNIPYIKEEDIRKSMTASPGAQSEVPNDSLAKGMSESSDCSQPRNIDNSGNGQSGHFGDCEPNGGTGTQTSADQASQDLQKLQSMIKELNSSSYLDKAQCNLCRQEFENKYFLRVHQMNDHGVVGVEDSAPIDSSAFMKTLFDANRSAFPLSQSVVQTGDSEAFCDICHKEMCSKYFLKTHKQNIHGIFEGPPTPTDGTPPSFPPHTPPHSFPVHRKSIDEAVNLAMSPNRSKSISGPPMQMMVKPPMPPMPPMTQSMVSQTTQMMSTDGKPRNITGRNYCNICNKELCNKYFMKTHMLKMHGINIDEHPVEASANSTIGGVTCDICQKELCSKYFLKVHKQNTHGIYEEPPQPKEPRNTDTTAVVNSADREPQPSHGIDPNDTNNRYFSHYTEVCPLCERRFKSIKWLKTHMINDHSDIVSMRPTDLSINGPNADLSRLCILCGQTFPDRVALHIHLVKEHRTSAEELGISGNNSGMKLATNTATDLSLKSELIPIGPQLTQHLSSHQMPVQSRLNGTTSPSSQNSTGMLSIHNSFNSQTQSSMNANNSLNKITNLSNTNTMNNNCMTMTSTPITSAITTSSAKPLNSTNTSPNSNTETNNAININTNHINITNSCNKTNDNIGYTESIGSNVNSMNASVITCPTITRCLTSSTSTLVTNSNTSASSSSGSTAIVKEEHSPSTLLSSHLSTIISKRTGCGTRIYQCSYCNYSTRWLSNLYAHEKRHTRLNTEADKKFVCRICHRAYRYNHSLQRHLLNHRSSGLNGRDVSAIALLAPNSSKELLSSGGLHSTSSDKLLGMESKFSRLLSGPSTLNRSVVRPNRIKRYRCSKCNRTFRTRDLCLAHIHVNHTDSRKIIMTSCSGKAMGLCTYCGFVTKNLQILKIHINTNHNKVTTSPATDLKRMANKALESPLNLRKSIDSTPKESALSLVTNKPESAVSPSGCSDDDSNDSTGHQAGSQLAVMGSEQQSPNLPMTYAMPQSPPHAGSFIMQPFLITQPDTEGSLTNDTFVPSLVYLPVSHKVLQPVRVAFHLTPA